MTEILLSNDDPLLSISKQFATICDSLTLFKMQINALQQQVKTVEKNVKREIGKRKKEKVTSQMKTKRAPSGFAKPTKVTKELCDFMSRPEGSEIARTEVTKALVNYIQTNNLLEKGEDTKNKIVPDEKLKILLGLSDNEAEDLNYFTIQKYMNKHFYSNKANDKQLTL